MCVRIARGIFPLGAQWRAVRRSLNEGETGGYVKLTAEEIAVKRSQRFVFLPECFSSPRTAGGGGL